jgi:GTP-binding protein
MLPVIALVGRPNVGKSTLFNVLTRSRDALVADLPGLTRDRQYGFGKVGPFPYVVVDTGGLSGDADGIDAAMARQTLKALEEADCVLLMVDGREGLTAADEQVSDLVRRSGKFCRLVVNKTEGRQAEIAVAEFHDLGIGDPVAISASHNHRVAELMDAICAELPSADESGPMPAEGIGVAVIGRPNVGKSTLINRILGEERLVAFDEPGTTRDSVFVPFERDGQRYTLIDTAGLRRRARVSEAIEKFSAVKTLQAIDRANVVIVLFDGREGVTDQDAALTGLVIDRGRALVLAVNKWDGLTPEQRDNVRRELELKLPFVDFARLHFISALHGSGVGDLFASVNQASEAAMRDLPTPELSRILERAVTQHAPPMVRGRRIKLRYAHQGGRNPPVIVVHGNQVDQLPKAYKRYLARTFREAFDLVGTPVRMEFRSGDNPYAGRRNKLTPRQEQKRRRMMKHVKKKGR